MQSTDFRAKIKLIVGLGNPGKEYANTPHNLGFLFVDFLKNYIKDSKEFVPITTNKKEYELIEFADSDLKLLKPLLYMNLSGEALQSYLKYQNISPEKILIAFDDLDIPFGNYKFQYNKFPKDHNGITSIQNITKTTEYNYLRIGAENRDEGQRHQIPSEKYLLKKLEKEQLEQIEELYEKIIVNIAPFLDINRTS